MKLNFNWDELPAKQKLIVSFIIEAKEEKLMSIQNYLGMLANVEHWRSLGAFEKVKPNNGQAIKERKVFRFTKN